MTCRHHCGSSGQIDDLRIETRLVDLVHKLDGKKAKDDSVALVGGMAKKSKFHSSALQRQRT